MIIAIDFDGTIADHIYPDCGEPVPGAIEWIKKFIEAGAKIILWTMRSDHIHGPTLTDAIQFCNDNGIELFGVNNNPFQSDWTTSPKAYANLYIDDLAFGCPLKENPRYGGQPYVDWDIVGPATLKILQQ